MREMSFTKIKATAQQPVQGTSHTAFVVLSRKLDCCILQILESESRFPFNRKYFMFLKQILNSLEGI